MRERRRRGKGGGSDWASDFFTSKVIAVLLERLSDCEGVTATIIDI